MQKFDDTVITDNGLNLLTSVNGGDDKIKYTKAVLASDDLTQAAATAIQKITTLSVKMSSPISINSRINDTINLSASFTNAAITEDFDFYCIGWYAKGIKDSTEYLIAVSPSTVKQTMPAGSNNAATASIEPKYAMALSRNAEVVINADPAGSVTKEYVDSQINELKTQGIINNGSIVSTADDCNKMITTSYRLVKGSVPQNAPDGFSTSGQIIVYGNKDTTDGVTQLAYDDINGTGHVRSYNPTNNKWAEWDLVITKSQLNAVLPTDIARTGENNDFKGKNTFETDPVDKNGDAYGLAKDIATKVTDNGDNSIEINKQAVTPVRDNKNGSINFNSKDMTPADDSAVVHTTGDETIDGKKKFDTDPTDGAGNAYAKTVDVNQQLDKKVTDNKDGTEQLNGVKVQPYNKLSDVTNLRNIVLQTDNVTTYTAKGGVGESIQDFPLYSGVSSLHSGTQFYYSYDLVVTNADGGVHWLGWGVPWVAFVNNQHLTTDGVHHFQGTTTIPDATSKQYIHSTIDNSHATYQITNLMIVVGSIPVTHLPAPEDKQDRIGYTPADDSKVVHSTDMRKPASDVVGLEDVPNGLYKGSLAENTDLNTLTQEGIYNFSGTSFVNFIDSNNHWGTIQIINKSAMIVQYIICTGNVGDQIFFRTQSGDPETWTPWTMIPRFGMDNGLVLPNGESLKPADDSKVAHLSGANNFNTVPTVNNNPLLLASSLPSDLARTGSDQEFTGKNTFDTAPIDKTTGNPYITKDGVPAVPSTLADTTKPANFTAGLQSGGVSVATSDDLKSVEKSAWHPVSVSMANFTIENAFYKKDNAKMTYELFIIAKDDIGYADQKDILFQDSNIHSFGDLNPDTVYGEFGLTYASLSGISGKVITKCSTSGNKIYYENSYSGYGPITSATIKVCGYIHITGTFE